MHNAKSFGNTLSEYVLLGSLIALACVGAFQLLGGSMGNLFEENSRHIDEKTGNNPGDYSTPKTLASAKTEKQGNFWGTPLGDLFGSPFQSGQSPDETQPGAAITGKQLSIKAVRGHSGGSDSATMEGELLNGGGTINLHTSSGGGVNATSAEGNTQKTVDEPTKRIQEALALVAKMEEQAAKMPEGPEKEWFLQTARLGFLLAGSQASDEVTLRGNQNKLLVTISDANLNSGDISYNIKTFYEQVQGKLGDMPANMTASEKKLGAVLVNSIVTTLETSQYNTSSMSANPKAYGKSAEEVKAKTVEAINNGELATGTGVSGTLSTSLTLDKLGQ